MLLLGHDPFSSPNSSKRLAILTDAPPRSAAIITTGATNGARTGAATATTVAITAIAKQTICKPLAAFFQNDNQPISMFFKPRSRAVLVRSVDFAFDVHIPVRKSSV